MYSQPTQAVHHRKTSSTRSYGKREQGGGRERVRLLQLLVCLALFLTVFIGKGVFPHRLNQLGEHVLGLISANTDFREAFANLGAAMAGQGSVLGEIGEFCIEVFGSEQDAIQVDVSSLTNQAEAEGRFLSSSPDMATLTAHYLRLEQLPKEWLPQAQTQPPAQDVPAPEGKEEVPTAVPAVGTVIVEADYSGPDLPEHYSMDKVSLGSLETVTPVMGPLRSAYGYREHPINGEYKFHNGVDIGANQGDPIHAFSAGTVEYVGQSDAYGLYLQIDHGNGVKSFYAHCSKLLVSKGQTVALGQTVAEVGSTGNATGPHLHLEMKYEGTHLDPAYYIDAYPVV